MANPSPSPGQPRQVAGPEDRVLRLMDEPWGRRDRTSSFRAWTNLPPIATCSPANWTSKMKEQRTAPLDIDSRRTQVQLSDHWLDSGPEGVRQSRIRVGREQARSERGSCSCDGIGSPANSFSRKLNSGGSAAGETMLVGQLQDIVQKVLLGAGYPVSTIEDTAIVQSVAMAQSTLRGWSLDASLHPTATKAYNRLARLASRCALSVSAGGAGADPYIVLVPAEPTVGRELGARSEISAIFVPGPSRRWSLLGDCKPEERVMCDGESGTVGDDPRCPACVWIFFTMCPPCKPPSVCGQCPYTSESHVGERSDLGADPRLSDPRPVESLVPGRRLFDGN